MPEIVTMGELLCEIMRPFEDTELFETGEFRGPYPSGAPGIFISTAARLGCSAGIIGGVGRDDFGKNILDRLRKDGVDLSHVLESDKGPTGVAFVTYYSDGDRKYIFHVDGTPAVEAKAPECLKGYEDTKYFHIMGCSLMAAVGFGKEIVKTMHQFLKQDTKISFDPNVRMEMLHDPEVMNTVHEVFVNSHIFMPGVSELKMLTGKNTVEEAVKEAFRNERLELLVLKNGSKGSQIYTRDGQVLTMGIYPVKQLDATGAGDSFDAAFICGLAQGKSLKEAAEMGAAAGALNAAAFGPMEGCISPDTVCEMINKNR